MSTADRVGGVLARAFVDDPMFRYVLPDPGDRRRHLPALFAGSARHAGRHGGVATAGGGAGVAVWTDDRHMAIGLLDSIRAGMLTLPLRIGPRALARLQRHDHPATELVRRASTAPFAYLQALGVEPARRGTGLGRATVAAALDQMRAAGFARCVLRTEHAANVGLYEHLGFARTGTGHVDASGLDVWTFARPTDDPAA